MREELMKEYKEFKPALDQAYKDMVSYKPPIMGLFSSSIDGVDITETIFKRRAGFGETDELYKMALNTFSCRVEREAGHKLSVREMNFLIYFIDKKFVKYMKDHVEEKLENLISHEDDIKRDLKKKKEEKCNGECEECSCEENEMRKEIDNLINNLLKSILS